VSEDFINEPIEVEPLFSFGEHETHWFDVVLWIVLSAVSFWGGTTWRNHHPYFETARVGDTIMITPDCEIQFRTQDSK
jgi:hypothetical protein